jgi:hypothetical protein
MATKFPNSGRLNYSQRKVHPKSPDLYGELALDRALIKTLLEATDEDEIVVKLDGWQNDGNYGTYFSLKVNTWKKPDGNVATPPAKPQPSAPVSDEDIPF